MSTRRRGSRGGGRRSSGSGGGGKNRRRNAASQFVPGGFLSEWKSSGGNGRHRATRKNLESELLLVEDSAFKRRGRTDFSCSSETQVVLAALPTRAAVFEDKEPSMTTPSSSRRSTKPATRRSKARKNRQRFVSASSSGSSSSDSEDFECSSSVDSELAEDYTRNLEGEISLEELSSEMTMRSLTLKVDLDSGGDETDEGTSVSNSESEEGDEDSDSDSSSTFHPGVGYSSGDSSAEEVEAVVTREEARLECLELSDKDELIGVMEPSFILDKGRKEKKRLDKARRQRGVPGEKKKRKKELIAYKRKERALRRGVDLDDMNLMFESMVISNCDMLALQPMKHRDLTLVTKLAAVYRLKVGAHGSGKKRFPTVTRTRHTAMPQGSDIEQLLKLMSRSADSAPKAVKDEAGRSSTKHKRAARYAQSSMERERNLQGKRNKRKVDGDRSTLRQQPLSFVSGGVIKPGDDCETSVLLVSETSVNMRRKELDQSAAPLGRFEAHTKGFGSRMLAKMGFVEGSGLGKDGQGMTQPLLPRMRPKSLGLGA